MCRNEDATGEEGNGKPPHSIHYPREDSALSLVSATLELQYAILGILIDCDGISHCFMYLLQEKPRAVTVRRVLALSLIPMHGPY